MESTFDIDFTAGSQKLQFHSPVRRTRAIVPQWANVRTVVSGVPAPSRPQVQV